MKVLVKQNTDALARLADWTKLSPQEMADLMSWTGENAGNLRMHFRGEIIVSRALRSPDLRGCPVCLREDAAQADGPATATMVMRGDWLMRDVVLCVKHGHPLVMLWSAQNISHRYDIGANLEAILPDLRTGAFDQPCQEPSPYDIWLDRRLADGKDDTALKDYGLFAATTFCRFLGMARIGEEPDPEGLQAGAFHAAGFEIVAQGAAAIRAEFDRLAARATRPGQMPKAAFGRLYAALSHDYVDDADFAGIRRILRDCILDHWPYGAGELLLGEPVVARRKHSIKSAAVEIGVTEKPLRKILIDAGAVDPDDLRPDDRVLFDAAAHAALLAEIPTLVGPIAMQNAMGATKPELVALKEEGLLRPRTSAPSVRNTWRVSDGQALTAKLLAEAVPVAFDDPDWETLLLARKRTGVALAALFAAIEAGSLKLGARQGVDGFHGLVVRPEQVLPLIATQMADLTEGGALENARVFGRSVGLRDNGHFVALIEAGHVSAKARLNPRTNQMQYWMDEADIAAFTARFATPTMLISETGLSRNLVYSLLNAARVAPFSPDGREFGAVFLRSDLAKIPQLAV